MEPVRAGRMTAVALRHVRHGAPIRSGQKMPFTSRRSLTRAVPRGVFGSTGSIAATRNPLNRTAPSQPPLLRGANQPPAPIVTHLGVRHLAPARHCEPAGLDRHREPNWYLGIHRSSFLHTIVSRTERNSRDGHRLPGGMPFADCGATGLQAKVTSWDADEFRILNVALARAERHLPIIV
jgi:hypothetical protein